MRMPLPRGRLRFTVAVLLAGVPVLLKPLAETAAPLAGWAVTVMGVLSGTLKHCTTTGTEPAC